MFTVSKKKIQKMSRLAHKSQLAMFAGAVVGSVVALFGFTKAASAASVSVGSSFAPILGDHVMELARMLAAPDQSASAIALTNHQMMLMIVSVGFLAMLVGSAAFWGTLQRDFSSKSNRR